MVKLRDLNKLRSRIGFSEVDSQMTKEIREITDITVSIIIVLELNQSRSRPLSSIICKPPTPSTNRVSPGRFILTGEVSVSLPLSKVKHNVRTIIPIGTLIKNIQPQLKLSQI